MTQLTMMVRQVPRGDATLVKRARYHAISDGWRVLIILAHGLLIIPHDILA